MRREWQRIVWCFPPFACSRIDHLVPRPEIFDLHFRAASMRAKEYLFINFF
jgi:hypothetical protein